jgi:hypothetical protein
LLDLPDRTAAVESVRENRIFQEYQTCFALEVLRLAREPADRPTIDDRPPAATLRERLDLRSFPNSLRPRLRAKAGATTLAQAGLVTTTSSPFTVTVSDPQWTFRLTALAAADFDADGCEDWLVRLVDRAKAGSYVGSCILVVHKVRDPGLLTANCAGTP